MYHFAVEPATLYIVATPIGNLGDITLRALEVLKNVDLIAAEDTRHTAQLLQHYQIKQPMFALHDHNEQQKAEQLISKLQQNQSIALVSDAGTPLINDPGYHLVNRCRAKQLKVVPIPGACAAITALCAAGLPSDRFCYEGFLAAKSKARQDQLTALKEEPRTLIFYESTHRLLDSLSTMQTIFGNTRQVVLAKELTKTWETIIKLPLSQLLEWLKSDLNRCKGEFVLIVEGFQRATDKECLSPHVVMTLQRLQQELPLNKAAAITAEIFGLKKNQLYKFALSQTTSE